MKAAQELLAVRSFEGLVESDFVLFVDLEAGMRERESEVAIVCDDEQAFALQIKAPDVKDAGPIRGKQVENRLSAMLILGAHDIAARLVENGMNGDLLMEHAVAHLHDIVRADCGGEIGDAVSIDSHAAFANDFFDATARAESGGRKESVKADLAGFE